MRRETWEQHNNDMTSVHMWVVLVLGIKASRADHLNMKSIHYYENKMRRGTWEQHNNDMTSVHMWVVHNPHNVFF
jgi:hypothetical protein